MARETESASLKLKALVPSAAGEVAGRAKRLIAGGAAALIYRRELQTAPDSVQAHVAAGGLRAPAREEEARDEVKAA